MFLLLASRPGLFFFSFFFSLSLSNLHRLKNKVVCCYCFPHCCHAKQQPGSPVALKSVLELRKMSRSPWLLAVHAKERPKKKVMDGRSDPAYVKSRVAAMWAGATSIYVGSERQADLIKHLHTFRGFPRGIKDQQNHGTSRRHSMLASSLPPPPRQTNNNKKRQACVFVGRKDRGSKGTVASLRPARHMGGCCPRATWLFARGRCGRRTAAVDGDAGPRGRAQSSRWPMPCHGGLSCMCVCVRARALVAANHMSVGPPVTHGMRECGTVVRYMTLQHAGVCVCVGVRLCAWNLRPGSVELRRCAYPLFFLVPSRLPLLWSFVFPFCLPLE